MLKGFPLKALAGIVPSLIAIVRHAQELAGDTAGSDVKRKLISLEAEVTSLNAALKYVIAGLIFLTAVAVAALVLSIIAVTRL